MTDKKKQSLERVIAVAVEAFSRNLPEEMSINRIAAMARCSTATIYEVFGSKEELYRLAATVSLERTAFPRLRSMPDSPVLFPLLDFCERRSRFLFDPSRADRDRCLGNHLEISSGVMKNIVKREYDYVVDTLYNEVQRCIAAGLMRPIEMSSLIYTISAGTAYEPMSLSTYYQQEMTIDPRDLLRKIFLPLLTEAGLVELDRYLSTPCERDAIVSKDTSEVRQFLPTRRRRDVLQ